MFDVLAKFNAQYRTLEARTVEEMGEWFCDRYKTYSMTTNGRTSDGPAATLSVVSVGDCDLKVLNWGAQVSGMSGKAIDRITVSLPVTGSSEICDAKFGKLRCANGQGVIYGRGAGTIVSSSAGTSKILLSIPVVQLEDAARSCAAAELNDPLCFSPTIDLTGGKGPAIKNLLTHILSCAVIDPSTLTHPLISSGLRDNLITTLIGVLPHNYSRIGAGLKKRDTTPRYVTLAEDYMRAHPDEAISAATLAREAGCSERTLQNSFKAYRDMSPIAVLRDIRLDYVRRDLATLEDSTVTDIAFKWGFSHLGRFAIAYASKFGEKPSETVRATRRILGPA